MSEREGVGGVGVWGGGDFVATATLVWNVGL